MLVGRSAALATQPRGAEWIAAWDAAQDPWFNFSSGNGMYSTDRVWLDHLEIPLGFVRDYVAPPAGRRRDRAPDRADPRRA